MHITFIELQIKPERLAEFLVAIAANQRASSREPGNLRFDVLQDPEQPCRIVIYEVYASVAEAAAHKQTPHFLHYQQTAATCYAAPRLATPMHGLHVGPVAKGP
jgi:(4S)-4-hydroxy-5-phosphonooxypentane-2,3-dione isomerase